MRGEISSGKFAKRHPYDWYVEEHWVTGQLIQALGFREEIEAGEAIWDPCCGMGNVAVAFEGIEFPHAIFLSDIVNRFDPAQLCEETRDRVHFFISDFRRIDRAPAPCSIVFNPPYSYEKGIAETFVRKALGLTARRVCALVPVKWLASQTRYRLFGEDRPPQAILFLTQRPSMPPGDRIPLMGARAFQGGMVDYCWVVWDVTQPSEPDQTRVIWLPPLGHPSPRERREIARSRTRGAFLGVLADEG